jgi:hypothetical protein
MIERERGEGCHHARRDLLQPAKFSSGDLHQRITSWETRKLRLPTIIKALAKVTESFLERGDRPRFFASLHELVF